MPLLQVQDVPPLPVDPDTQLTHALPLQYWFVEHEIHEPFQYGCEVGQQVPAGTLAPLGVA